MSTLFVGRLRGKQDRAIAAAPQIAAGFQQASDALRAYEADRQARQKEDMLKASMVAKIAGGWANTSQEFKNELPRLFGMDFPTDDGGNVQIDPTWDELLEKYRIDTIANDPQKMEEAAMIDADLMTRARHPSELELIKERGEQALTRDRQKDAIWWEREDWKRRVRADEDERAHNYRLGEKAYAASLRDYGKGKQGDKGSNPSGIYLDTKDGQLMDEAQLLQKYPDSSPDSVRMLTNDEFSNNHKKKTLESEERARKNLQELRSVNTRLGITRLQRVAAANPQVMGLMDAKLAKMRTGTDTKQEDMQVRQIQIQELKNAGLTDEEAEAAVESGWGIFQNVDSFEKFYADIAAQRQQGNTSPSQAPGGIKILSREPVR